MEPQQNLRSNLMRKIAIVGGGQAGLPLALALRRLPPHVEGRSRPGCSTQRSHCIESESSLLRSRYLLA